MKFAATALVFMVGVMTASAMCPGEPACSGHGTCGNFDLCTCHRKWTGADCGTRMCEYLPAWQDTIATTIDSGNIAGRSNHHYAECSGRGTCDAKTGECDCFDGFTGSGCQRMKCPEDCSGHGVCNTMRQVNAAYTGWDTDMIQTCTCDPGWEGAACANRMCKPGDDPLTLHLTSDLSTLQVDEVQTITISTSSGGVTGTFALKFKDWRGKTWYTSPINIATATAITIEEYLEAIPNYALPDITVTKTGDASDVSSTDLVFSVTFSGSGNAGTQPILLVDDGTCSTNGCQPVIDGVTGTGKSIVVTRSTTGTKESAVCSNRGNCDSETGTCKCAAGYTGESCEIQTIIT